MPRIRPEQLVYIPLKDLPSSQESVVEGQFVRSSLSTSVVMARALRSEAVADQTDVQPSQTLPIWRAVLDWPHWTTAFWISFLLSVGTWVGFAWLDTPGNTAITPAGEVGAVSGVGSRPDVEGWSGFESALLDISRIRVGMRVAAENPEVSDAERRAFVDPDPATWRLLKLRLPKNQSTDSGSASSLVLTPTLATDYVAIDLLRPLEWLEQQRAVVGGRVFLDLEELGAKGWADVLEIGPCPEIVPGPGSVVTATFAHQPTSAILDVTITAADGSEETIGVTANHPFWSVDHQAFVPVSLLPPGSLVKTYAGQTQTITTLLPRPGPAERVYNLEVHGEHVYYVGTSFVLVHNNYVDFVHGTTRESAESIIKNGLSRSEAVRLHKRGTYSPGDFYAFGVTKPTFPDVGMDAMAMAGRHGGSTLLLGRLKRSDFDRLVKQGKIKISNIGGAGPEYRILNEHFDEVNRLVSWEIIP